MARRHSDQAGDLESVFLRLEELVLANSGEDDFEEVLKLIIAKLCDERNSAGTRFRTQESPEATFESVIDLLRNAARLWPGLIDADARPMLTPEHLQVCVAVLAKHRLSDTALEALDSFFELMVAKAAKGAKGQYFTPRYVVEFCVQMLRPQAHETVLDPACGSAGFLIHALNYVKANSSAAAADVREYAATKLWGFDFDHRATRVAKTLMILAGDGCANVARLNSLLRPDMFGLFQRQNADGSENGSVLTIEDVTRSRLRHHRGFDVILTNPPFAGEVRERHVLNGYALSQGRDRVERDVLFIERCVELLRPGGRMAIVVPHNKLATDAYGYVRDWLIRKTRVLGVVGLGRNTFLPHTHQKTSVLFLEKRETEARVAGRQPVFFGVSERDAKNSKGQLHLRLDGSDADSTWLRADHDLGEFIEPFHRFCQETAVTAEG